MAQNEEDQGATLLNNDKSGPNEEALNPEQARHASVNRKSAILWICAIPLLFLLFNALSAIFHHATASAVYPPGSNTNYPIGGGWAKDGKAYGHEPAYRPVGPVQSNGTHDFERSSSISTTLILSLTNTSDDHYLSGRSAT